MSFSNDAINAALGIADGSALDRLRALRPEFVAGAEACRASVLTPDEDLGLSPELRAALGRRVANGGGNARLAEGYPLPADPELALLATGDMPDDPALAALARHSDMIANSPAKAGRQDLATLQDAGFTVPQIIALSELLAYACYQIRVVHGLNLLKEPRP
ncbi:CMD domain-containing protein [Salipiger abyssi]|uniref:CMD domain-containing protein n=1 Tax=Salipiger abyssi TaxID=1250539 RepID=UPI0040585006